MANARFSKRKMIALEIVIALVLSAIIIGIYLAQTERVKINDLQVEVETQLHTYANSMGQDISEQRYIATLGNCRIQWQIVEVANEEQRYLEMTRQCALSFSEQVAIHRELLRRITQVVPLQQIQFVKWHGLCDVTEIDWCRLMVEASVKDAEFQARVEQAAAQPAGLNHVFVRLANDLQIYVPLSALLSEFGVQASLRGVEGLQMSSLAQSPYASSSESAQNAQVFVGAKRAYFFLQPQ